MKRLLIVLVVGLIVLAGVMPVGAQTGEAIPECAVEDMVILALTVPEYLENYANIAARVQDATLEDYADIAADLHNLQVDWWSEAVPDMPRCALAIDIQLIVGRLLDESLLSVLAASSVYYDLATPHIEAMGDLADKMADLSTLIDEWVSDFNG